MGNEEKGEWRLQGKIGCQRVQANPRQVICPSQYFVTCHSQHYSVNHVGPHVDGKHGATFG